MHPMKRLCAMTLSVAALLALAGCGGGKPDGCVQVSAVDAADLMKAGAGGYPTAAARLDADGGQYVAATIKTADGGDATAVWFIDDQGKGARTSVGAVTKLFSNFPSSDHVGITVSSGGYDDVQRCLED